MYLVWLITRLEHHCLTWSASVILTHEASSCTVWEKRVQPTITREQIWERLGKLDSFQQQNFVTFIDSLLQPKTPAVQRDKSWLLALSVCTDEDVARVHKAQDEINAWNIPAS